MSSLAMFLGSFREFTLPVAGALPSAVFDPDYIGLARGLLPEAALVAGALAVLGVDITLLRRGKAAVRFRAAAAIAAAMPAGPPPIITKS